MTAYERMRRLAQVLDEHRRTVPVAVAPSGTAVVELGDSALLWRLTAADGTHRDERVLSPAPVDACVHLPDRGEIVWIADTADGVRAAAADAGDGRPLRRSLLPQWAAENWTDLVAADLNGRQTALLLVEPSAGRCLVDPFSGAVAAHWAAAEAEQDAEVAAFAARGEHWWRWERRVGVRPSYTLHDDAGRSQEFPGVLLDVRGTCSLWSVPAPDGSELVLHDAADGSRRTVRTRGEALDGTIESPDSALAVVNGGVRQRLLRWRHGTAEPPEVLPGEDGGLPGEDEEFPGEYGELTLFGAGADTVLAAEESLLVGVRHLEISGRRVRPLRLGPQLPEYKAELVELADRRCWAWLPQDCRGLVVSLHGGPESGERDGLRYAGLYRELLEAGVAVVVWNYPSSTGFGTGWRSAAHGDWAKVLGADLDLVLGRLPARVRGLPAGLLGVSFGAWAGLQAVCGDRGRRFSRAVLSAPMLDLESHRQRMGSAAELAEFVRFFDDTFGTPGAGGYHTAGELVRHGLPALHVVHGEQDEVVDPVATAAFCERAGAAAAAGTAAAGAGAGAGAAAGAGTRVVLADQGHAPQGAAEAAERYQRVLGLLLQCFGEQD